MSRKRVNYAMKIDLDLDPAELLALKPSGRWAGDGWELWNYNFSADLHVCVTPAQCQAIADHFAALTVELEVLDAPRQMGLIQQPPSVVEALRALTVMSQCDRAVDGGCREHGYPDLEPSDSCPMIEAQQLLDACSPGWRRVTVEGDA